MMIGKLIENLHVVRFKDIAEFLETFPVEGQCPDRT